MTSGTPARVESEAFDAVVIGSGFGGSVMTYRLSQERVRVCLLERGRAYPPGTFLHGASDAGANFWNPSAGLHGLFNVWSFRRMAAIVSSGLGGGSLIYANVLLRKPPDWFSSTMPGGEPWPFSYDDLEPHYEAVEEMLGATEYPLALRERTPKTRAFVDGVTAAGFEPFFPKLAVSFAEPGREGEQFDSGAGNRFRAGRFTCRLTGECDVGCNYGAKNTLDLTYLSRLGATADVRPGSEVKTLAGRNGCYEIGYLDHGAGGVKRVLTARRVILAAGSLGSTYLLLRNAERLGGLSLALGGRFSGNGDVLAFALDARESGRSRRIEPAYGPVITAAAFVPDDEGRGRDLVLEDGGGPSAVWWIATVLEAPRRIPRLLPVAVRVLRRTVSRRPERDIGADLAELVSGVRLASGTLPLLVMGRDLPAGRLRLRGELLDLAWGVGDTRDYYRRAKWATKRVADGLGARFSGISFVLNYFVTVHPLGGCPIGPPTAGVVDDLGRVHGHERGLYVADGSVMPGPVGANPGLTIAAFADRAAASLLREL